MQEFNKTWDLKCHRDKYKVDPSSMCSVIQYLSEVRDNNSCIGVTISGSDNIQNGYMPKVTE